MSTPETSEVDTRGGPLSGGDRVRGGDRVYVELDGLRGVAALAVVLMHLHEQFGAAGAVLDRHAYLAVDFFMLLSGFVIAHAYEERLRDPAARRGFLIDRVIRLYPLLILGAVVGFLSAAVSPDYGGAGLSALYLVAAIIPLPMPPIGDAWAAFPLNFPTWSLFWEIILNVAVAFVAPNLTTRRLMVMVALCLSATLALGMQHGRIDIGATFPGVIGSAPRMTGEFAAGVLLLRMHRKGWFARGGVRWWVPVIVVACFYLLPKEHGWSLAFDMIAIAVVLPCSILLAAGSEPVMPALARVSGSVSYPLYILHIPLSGLVAFAFDRAGVRWGVVSGSVAVLIVVAAAYGALVLYDQPLRGALRRRFGSRRHRGVTGGA